MQHIESRKLVCKTYAGAILFPQKANALHNSSFAHFQVYSFFNAIKTLVRKEQKLMLANLKEP